MVVPLAPQSLFPCKHPCGRFMLRSVLTIIVVVSSTDRSPENRAPDYCLPSGPIKAWHPGIVASSGNGPLPRTYPGATPSPPSEFESGLWHISKSSPVIDHAHVAIWSRDHQLLATSCKLIGTDRDTRLNRTLLASPARALLVYLSSTVNLWRALLSILARITPL